MIPNKIVPNKIFPAKIIPARIVPAKIDNKLPTGVVCYCKDCNKIVETNPVGRKFAYRCKICSTKNVAFGSEKSIRNFYHIKDADQTNRPMSEEERKAMNADKL